MLLQPKSVYRLMLASFLLVALPLMAGLLILLFQMDRLSTRMQTIVGQSASVMEALGSGSLAPRASISR